MDLFTRKMHLFCVSNIMVSFVCTGFLGIKGYAGTIEVPDENAHEISLIASDTEPVSQNGEGEKNLYSFVLDGADIIAGLKDKAISGQDVVNSVIAKNNDTKKTTSVVSKKEVKNTVTYTPASYSSVTGDAIVSYAKKYLGLRYKTGTPSLSSGADCSGFTMLIYREFGVSLPRTVGGQMGRGSYISKSDLQKGDLVFYKAKGSSGGASHVGIYIGGGQVIHESRPGVGVKISSVNMMQYVTARRVINSTAKQIAEQKLAEEQKKNEVITDNTSSADVVDNTNTTDSSKEDVTSNVDNNVNNNVKEETAVVSDNSEVSDTNQNAETNTTTEVVEVEPKEEPIQKEETEVKEEPKKEESVQAENLE